MNTEPLVSVVIATRNAERHLATALASVAEQTYDNVEVIVVDKASTDRSVEIARAHGARCTEQRGSGFAGAWNEGIEVARGDLIGMLDSDDLWAPGKLEAQVRLLEARPELDYAIGRVRFFLEPGVEQPPGFDPRLLGTDHVAHMPGALLARRAVFDEVGPFRTDYNIASDIDWFARLKDAGMRTEVAEGALTFKRVHDSNLSYFEAEDMNSEILRLLRASVARQRSASR
jgi:glycosyltransferase involved in cell wall biosynthesis